MKIIIILILNFLVISCAPSSGELIRSTVSESGGYGTIYFQGSKITGNFSNNNQFCKSCTSERSTPETSSRWGTKLIIIGDRKVVNNSWTYSGIQNFEITIQENKYDDIIYVGNAGKNCSEALCNMEVKTVNYKSKNYNVNTTSTKEAREIVFNQIREKEKIAKELKLKQEEEKAKEEKIAKFKTLCSEMGFVEETEGMSNCILQLLTKSSNQVVVTTDDSSLSEQNQIMEEQTRIMERQLRQQRLQNLRESQKLFKR